MSKSDNESRIELYGGRWFLDLDTAGEVSSTPSFKSDKSLDVLPPCYQHKS